MVEWNRVSTTEFLIKSAPPTYNIYQQTITKNGVHSFLVLEFAMAKIRCNEAGAVTWHYRE